MTAPVAPGRWPFLGHTPALLRQRFAFTSSLHEHGEIVKLYLGPAPTYFVTSPRLAHEVLVTAGPKFRKGAMFDKFRPFVGNGLVLSNGDFHRSQRRLMQPAFHRDRLIAYAEIMRRAAAELGDSWRAGEVRPVDEDMQRLAVTIVGEALFSTELGKEAIAEARRSIYLIIQQGMIRALSPKFVEKLPVPGNRRFDEAITRMREIVLAVIREWRADGTDHGDLLSTLLLAGMTDEQARDEVLTLLTAGIETTALALSWTFHELGRHPEVEARVHAEVDEVLGGDPVTAENLGQLTYVRQVVDEVLRRYPLWMLMRRTLEEVDLGGVRLPEGAEVIVSPHALHHDPASFPDPTRFDPGRWAPDRAAEQPKGAFIPFGAGNRQCIGNRFAQNEIVITVATVAARWRLVPLPGHPVRVKFTSAAYPDSLPMTAVPRR
ncbi:cytochrome P450 [Amycolatopsis sp. SID8362]|uniref:cytochrome P450 n=1 Tax=Amycolatopsis sp. SID8362 TaxID=2690346 RepID=UPI001368D2A5|nr:cytochrome P450 [Amycolatopsis sp. SID8362]NBH06862.1 cytochrome P450 [Amycolatopsis sp. SID8362]NED43559.1 cytochrome P450 [Amycolatopsis sp. SID8362]